MSKKTEEPTFQFDKFIKDLDDRREKRDENKKKLSESEEATANRRRAAKFKEDWRNRVRWSRK